MRKGEEYAVLLAKGKTFIHATVITFRLRPETMQKSLAFRGVAGPCVTCA